MKKSPKNRNKTERFDATSLIILNCLETKWKNYWSQLNYYYPKNPRVLMDFCPDKGIREIKNDYVSEGLRGVFYKGESLKNWAFGIKLLFSNGLWLPRQICDQIVLSLSNALPPTPEEDDGFQKLTSREKEILIKVASGASNQEIADALFITKTTVKSHIMNIYRKIGVSNRVEATIFAMKKL